MELDRIEASEKGLWDVARRRLEEGADPNQVDIKGCTPLHYASFNGFVEVVRELLAAGADPNKGDLDERTPLYHATYYGFVEVVRELLAAGADPNKVDIYDGFTPLHFASNNDRVDVVRALLAAGADPTKADTRGSTPLQIAERGGHNECTLLLRSAFEPWRPDNHALFPPAFRAAVRTVLCVHNRRPELVGDVEVWLHVLSFAGREWFGAPAPATNDG